MRTHIHIPATPFRAVLAVALALTAACDDGTGPDSWASSIDFDALAVGEQVGTQYRAPARAQFVTSPSSCGLVCSVPGPQRWRIPCEALPTVMEYAAAPSGKHVALLRSGSGEFASNAVCISLDRSAGIVSVRVRNESGGGQATLVAVNALGVELERTDYDLDPNAFITIMAVSTDRDIAGFAIYGPRTARLVIDDVWITRPG